MERTRRMHNTAYNETADGAAGEMERGAVLHAQVFREAALRKEVSRQLDRAPETSPDHSGADTTVQTKETLASVDLHHAVDGVPVLVLGADGVCWGVALQPGLDEEEGRSGRGADDARRGSTEHVDGEGLGGLVLEEETCHGLPHGVVEAQTATVEEDLVDIGATDTAVDAPEALIAHNHANALYGVTVVFRLAALVLKLSLQLHSIKRR